MIEEQPHKENIKKFLRAIEISKEIELENIEELINGEYEIDRSEIIETISNNTKYDRILRSICKCRGRTDKWNTQAGIPA